MRMKAYLAIALAVWMTWAAFLSLPAGATASHIMAGGMRGPAGSVAAGPANAANNASGNANPYAVYAFYSTNQPTFPVQSCIWNPPVNDMCTGGVTFTPADGTNPALFLRDVGSDPGWTWSSGDTVVAVVETIRGVNGWAGLNYTTSLDAVMSTANGTTDMGNATLEQIPPLTLFRSGPGYVNVTWTPLADAQGNVVSYHLYRAPTAYGAYGSAGVTGQAAGTRSFNNTGLGAGTYCYELAVQYRRDLGSGTYETRGRSEPGPSLCATITAAPPTITNTSPYNGETNVPLAAPIIVNFSEAIDHVGHPFSYTMSTDPGGRIDTWTNADQTLTITHTPFTICTRYTWTIVQAYNGAGVNLGPGTAPNPWYFDTICPNPQVSSTSPVNGTTGVRRSSNVVITFNKAMNPASVTVVFSPAAGSPTCAWSAGNTVCTLAVTLGDSIWYAVNVTGQDTAVPPNSLIPGSVPYHPFFFKSNDVPTNVNFSRPGVGWCAQGGTTFNLIWTMSDAETPTTSLRSWLNYTLNSITYQINTAVYTGQSSPATYPWGLPAATDGSVQVWLQVYDGAGDFTGTTSNTLTIDSTRPTVSSTTPTGSQQNVATDATIQIVFSEAMNTTADWPSIISFTPTVTGPTFTWSNGDKTLTVGHPAAFQVNTQYTLHVAATAQDACRPGPGLTMSANYDVSFKTGAGPRRPSPPTNVKSPSQSDTSITISWDAPTNWTDGTSLAATDITGYRVYRSTGTTCDKTQTPVGTPQTKTLTDSGLTADTTYNYWVTAVAGGLESDCSALASAKTLVSNPPGFPWWIVIVIIVVVILLIVGLLLLRRKPGVAAPPKGAGPEEAPPAEGAEEAPAEGAPAEGGGEAASEGGEKFIPCPNCGTMVKPTDAECFVCGAKL